jgi:hypothetical protein
VTNEYVSIALGKSGERGAKRVFFIIEHGQMSLNNIDCAVFNCGGKSLQYFLRSRDLWKSRLGFAVI